MANKLAKSSPRPKSQNGGRRCSSSSSSGSSNSTENPLRQHEHMNFERDQPSPLNCFFNALARKKPLDCRTDTNLNRCLNLVDLTALGVGSTLGLGLYVLAGQVASVKAGPAVVVSFAMAALASAFSALCYAEFAGRVPRAGSAYAYSYISVGEFVAFIIGWNLILEYVIGASSVARGFSGYLRFVFNHVSHSLGLTATAPDTQTPNQPSQYIHNHHHHHQLNITSSHLVTTLATNSTNQIMAAQMLVHHSSAASTILDSIFNYVVEYFDWPSVVIIAVLTVFILVGVKESTNVTLAFTSVNLLVVVGVVISSLGSLDLHNWQLAKSEVPNGYGEGGFIPYGWSGVIAGSATCFFGFIGFDTIASSAEEAKNPKRNVPLSIILSLFISFVAYMAVAIVQTLLWPYYDQNKVTILPFIFGRLDMPITYWFVLLGAIAGLASSQLGGMYPLPRILYSMAHDKLIYGYLSHVNRRLKLPVRATIVGSCFVAILSCLLDIADLADMVSIGTLAAYSLVSLSVLILRYEDRSDAVDDSTIINNHLTFTDILNTMEHSIGGEDGGTGDAHLLKTRNTVKLSHTNSQTTKDSVVMMSTNPNHQTTFGEDRHQKLTTKPSTPIREKGSKPLAPQLSVGFQSWFKSGAASETNNNGTINGNTIQEMDGENGVGPTTGTGVGAKRQSLLDLLIIWKADDQMRDRSPDDESSRQSKILISLIVVLSIVIDIVALCLTYPHSATDHTNDHPIVGAINRQQFIDPMVLLGCTGCMVLVVLAAVMLMLSRLPISRNMGSNMFQVPLVPLIPTLSILVNIFLMLNLSYLTWVRFTIWMTVGLFIYFTYGIWNSEGYLLYNLDR